MTTPIVNKTVSMLRELIARTNDSALPSVTNLATRFGVSRVTVMKAAGILREQNELSFSPRSRMMICGRGTPSEPSSRSSAVTRIRETLLEWICEGKLRLGMPFPKSAYLCKELNISPSTLANALRGLAREGHVHRRGRKWVVGRRGMKGDTQLTDRPTILILTPSSDHWNAFCTSNWLLPFGQNFAEQARAHGVQLEQALKTPLLKKLDITSLNREMNRRITELGDQYLGTLIPGELKTGVEQTVEWIKMLLSFGKPVVFFDRSDIHPPLISSDLYYHFHSDEQAVVRLAVSYLADREHSKVVYVYDPSADWQVRRWKLLESIAPEFGIEMLSFSMHEVPAQRSEAQMEEMLRRILVTAPTPLKNKIAHINKNLPRITELYRPTGRGGNTPTVSAGRFLKDFGLLRTVTDEMVGYEDLFRAGEEVIKAFMLCPVFLDQTISCVISPNDKIGRIYLVALLRMGFPIPGRVSLLSFDNWFRFSFIPLTTIDFGFGELGYKAFHALYGDILPKADDGGIATNPMIEERGSVADRRTEKLLPDHPRRGS